MREEFMIWIIVLVFLAIIFFLFMMALLQNSYGALEKRAEWEQIKQEFESHRNQ